MSSSSDDNKRLKNMHSIQSWAFNDSARKAIERSKMPDSFSSNISRASEAIEAIEMEKIGHATLAAQIIEQQRSLASEILGRHGEMFAALEAATKSRYEIGKSARAAIESMQLSGTRAVAQAMKMSSRFIESNQLIPPINAAHLSVIESGIAANAGVVIPLTSLQNLSKMGEIASTASSLRFSHLTIPNLDAITGNVARMMEDMLAGVEQIFPSEAHALREHYDEVVTEKGAPAKSLTSDQARKYIEFIIILLMLFMEVASFQAAQHESRLTSEFREQQTEFNRELLTQLHAINHYRLEAHGMEPGQSSGLTEYVVLRSVNLRTHQGTGPNSHTITTLHPNQKVELIQRGEHPYKKWIYVSYIDEIAGIPRYGWVYKKYLKRIGS